MKFAHFFVDHPVFAAVISILITLLGAIALPTLPVAQYPQIAPPTVNINATYPGASAETLASTVAQPIEEQINGVEDMLYMSSQSTGDGHLTITVTFKLGADIDKDLVLVENRAAVAIPQLPSAVQATGLVVRKSSPDLLLAVHMYSPDNSLDQPVHLQLTSPCTSTTSCCACPASATSAAGRRATTPCGSGSIRQGRPAQPDRR